MEANMLRKVVSTVLILLGSVAGASVAEANLMNGSITSGTGADVFKLKCGAGTVGAKAVIQDATPLPDGVQLSVHVVRLQNRQLSATTATTPDAVFGMANLAGGVGNYHFIVTKNGGSQVKPYQIDPYCYNAAGARMGPDASQTQDDQDDT